MILRSINPKLDVPHPDRFVHYIPSELSADVILRMLSFADPKAEKAFVISAPYGSGKSLLAAYFASLLDNNDSAAEELKAIDGRLKRASTEAALAVKKHRSSGKRYLPVLLHGQEGDLPTAIVKAIERAFRDFTPSGRLPRNTKQIFSKKQSTFEDLQQLLKIVESNLKKRTEDDSHEGLFILWDEFGKQLEVMAREGGGNDLFALQSLAELASRSSRFPIGVALFLHQSLARYSERLPSQIRNEWIKIEGRFRTIRFLEESKDVYGLIRTEISRSYSQKPDPWSKRSLSELRSAGILADVPITEIEKLIKGCQRLTPPALFLLPRISNRLAQGDRTLFSFLLSDEPFAYQQITGKTVGPWHLFDYFQDLMRSDTSVGGAYRSWLTVSHAMRAAESDIEIKVLKTACLFSILPEGSRPKISQSLLLTSINDQKAPETLEAIASLVKKRVLVHRKHTDDYLLWEGSGADLRGMLQKKMALLGIDFNLNEEIAKHFPQIIWTTGAYNREFKTTRHWEGRVERQLNPDANFNSRTELAKNAFADGLVVLVAAETEKAITDAVTVAKSCDAKNGSAEFDRRICFVIPKEPVEITKIAVELKGLKELARDDEFLSSDPTALKELNEHIDGCLQALSASLATFRLPDPAKCHVYIEGKQQKNCKSRRSFLSLLNEIYKKEFSKSPKINFELVNKESVSANLSNARKKLIRHLLDNEEKESFGLTGYGPEITMYRAFFLNSELHVKGKSGWKLKRPPESNEKLEFIHHALRFFEGDEGRGKDTQTTLEAFIEHLRRPPFSVKSGLIPLIFTTCLKIARSGVSLCKDGHDVITITADVIDDACRKPAGYSLSLCSLSNDNIRELKKITMLFSECTVEPNGDYILTAMKALYSWAGRLSEYSRATRSVSKDALAFRELIMNAKDSVALFSVQLPEFIRSRNPGKGKSLVRILENYKNQLESTAPDLYDTLEKDILEILLARGIGTTKTPPVKGLKLWLGKLPAEVKDQVDDINLKGLIARIEDAAEGKDSREQYIRGVATQITGKSMMHWTDTEVARFRLKLAQAMGQIEEIAEAMFYMDKKANLLLPAHLAKAKLSKAVESLIAAGTLESEISKHVKYLLNTHGC